MRKGPACVVVLSILLAAGSLRATSLNLVPHFPDIWSNYILVNYNSASEMFTASGQAFTLSMDEQGSAYYDIIDGPYDYDIWAKIDHSGNPIIGSLTITGYVPELLGDKGSGTLLTGTLQEFGFPNDGGDPLEFTFTNTGGDLAGYFPQANVIMASTGFGGTFNSDFGNSYDGYSDTFVPEPVTFLTVLGALAALGGYIRKRIRQAVKLS